MSDVIAGIALVISAVALVLSWLWHKSTDERAEEANKTAREANDLAQAANRIAEQTLKVQDEQASLAKADRAERMRADLVYNRRESDGRLSLTNTGPGTAANVAVRTKQGDIIKQSRIITSIAPGQTSYASDFKEVDRRPEEDVYVKDRNSPGAAVRILWTNADGTTGDSNWSAARL